MKRAKLLKLKEVMRETFWCHGNLLVSSFGKHYCFVNIIYLSAYATDANKIKFAQLFEVAPDLTREKLLSLKDEVLNFERASTVGGALFGSVSVADVKSFFNDRAIEVEKIELVNGSLKELGLHTVKVDGVDFQINIVEPPSNLKKDV